MNAYENSINNVFNNIYDSLNLVEQNMLKNSKLDLSICEIHFLHTIGKYENGCSISDIARDNKVTLPTVTVAIQKLVNKNFVEKVRSTQDLRMVNVVLTRMGKKATAAHRFFHERMVRAFLKDVEEDVRPKLLQALSGLSDFLEQMGEAQ